MLDTVGPELQVINKTERPISLEADTLVVLTPDQGKEASSNLLPINFMGLAKVQIYFISLLIYFFCYSSSGILLVYLCISCSFSPVCFVSL